MSISQMMIAGSNSGRPPKSIDGWGITYEPLNEGQQQTITLHFSNWDNSNVYWIIRDSNGGNIDSQLNYSNGYFNPGNGDSSQSFNFTFLADATTEGTQYYRVYIGSYSGGSDYLNNGPYVVRDSSQTPALVLDLDSANCNIGSNSWTDTSGTSHDAGIYFATTSSDNGGVLLWNGTSTQAEVPGLVNSIYGTITLSTWIKPTTTGSDQVLIAKELVYKLALNSNSAVTFWAGPGYAPWYNSITSDASTITAGQWHNVVATVDNSYMRIYINGIKVVENSGTTVGSNGNPFDIGFFTNPGDNVKQNFFGGSMGEVKVWNCVLSEADVRDSIYNASCARYGLNPIPRSLVFNDSSHQYIGINGTSDWALGTTWTIEYWNKHTTATTSGGPSLYTVMSQAPADGGIDIYYQGGNLMFNNGTTLVNEPPAGRWTHVALVCDAGNINVYYNGRQQTLASPVSANLGNSSDPLYIGRRGNNDFQYYPGELTGIRINNTALYNTTFTPDRLPTAPSGTKLLLNGYYPLVDQSTSAHSISNGGSTLTYDFPKLPASGGTGGAAASANGFTVTPSISGRSDASTAYAGDTITWTITSNPGYAGYTMYYWVDGGQLPPNTFVENSIDGGPISLDGNGSATFTRTVAQNVNMQFRMFIGHTLYQGGDYPFHGYIGV